MSFLKNIHVEISDDCSTTSKPKRNVSRNNKSRIAICHRFDCRVPYSSKCHRQTFCNWFGNISHFKTFVLSCFPTNFEQKIRILIRQISRSKPISLRFLHYKAFEIFRFKWRRSTCGYNERVRLCHKNSICFHVLKRRTGTRAQEQYLGKAR